MIGDKKAVIIPIGESSPVGYMNMVDEGDVWVKTVGCETCPDDVRYKCCPDACPLKAPDGGCAYHGAYGLKPLRCIYVPTPDSCKKGCVLEYKCVQGEKVGWVRRVQDAKDTFITT